MYQYRIRGKEPNKPWGKWTYGGRNTQGSKTWAQECGERRLATLKGRWPTITFEMEIVGE